jgi:hypothetical protein
MNAHTRLSQCTLHCLAMTHEQAAVACRAGMAKQLNKLLLLGDY